jgi:hypothetical protein
MPLNCDHDLLIKIHQPLILSVIEYGAVAYGSARKSILEKLNSTHHQGLRIALGAFSFTWIENLMCEIGISTLHHRRLLITTKTAIRSMTISVTQKFKNFDFRGGIVEILCFFED